jgi:hypothetical protein
VDPVLAINAIIILCILVAGTKNKMKETRQIIFVIGPPGFIEALFFLWISAFFFLYY